MTDQQFYLVIGIPSALFALNFLGVLAGFFWQSKRLDELRDSLRLEIAGLKSDISRMEGTLRS